MNLPLFLAWTIDGIHNGLGWAKSILRQREQAHGVESQPDCTEMMRTMGRVERWRKSIEELNFSSPRVMYRSTCGPCDVLCTHPVVCCVNPGSPLMGRETQTWTLQSHLKPAASIPRVSQSPQPVSLSSSKSFHDSSLYHSFRTDGTLSGSIRQWLILLTVL